MEIEHQDAERFIELVDRGVPLATAARQINSEFTVTRVQWYIRRFPELRERFERAMNKRRQMMELFELLGV